MYFLFFGFDLAQVAMLLFYFILFLFWGFWFGFVLYSYMFSFSFGGGGGDWFDFVSGNVRVFFSNFFWGMKPMEQSFTRRFLPNFAINEI